MEKLARRFANNIALSLGLDREKEAVIAYGLIAMIQIAMTILLVALFGSLVGAPVEALIICFSGSVLRKYSGGAHAETAELCTLISVIYCTITAFLSKNLLTGIYNAISMAIAILVIFAAAFFVIYKFAPVDSPNKPIRTEKKKKRMRKGSFLTLFCYLVFSAVFWAAGDSIEVFKSYGISLLFGLSWQIFTLTYYGHLFIGKINHIYFFRKEGMK